MPRIEFAHEHGNGAWRKPFAVMHPIPSRLHLISPPFLRLAKAVRREQLGFATGTKPALEVGLTTVKSLSLVSFLDRLCGRQQSSRCDYVADHVRSDAGRDLVDRGSQGVDQPFNSF